MKPQVYVTVDEAWNAAVGTLNHKGEVVSSRNGDTRELLNVTFTLAPDAHRQPLLLNNQRNLSPSYAAAELLWYLSGSDAVHLLVPYAPSYARFGENNGRAHGAYGARLFAHEGGTVPNLQLLLRHLDQKLNSRQAVVSLWDNRHDLRRLHEGFKDYPCTLTLQALVRSGQLHLLANMRSNDVWLGLPYDLFCFMGIQRFLSWCLKVDYGYYCHYVGSFHLYEKSREAAQAASIGGRHMGESLQFRRGEQFMEASVGESPDVRFHRACRAIALLFLGSPETNDEALVTIPKGLPYETRSRIVDLVGEDTMLSGLAALAALPHFIKLMKNLRFEEFWDSYRDFCRRLLIPEAVESIKHLVEAEFTRVRSR